MPRRGEPCVRPYINGLSPALSFRVKRRISSLFRGEIPLYVRNDKGGYLRHLRNLRSVFCHSERQRRISFRYFWLDPKVTKKSRLRALHTSSRRLQVGKSGNLLRFGQPDFLSPCSLLRRLTARGRRDERRGRSRRDSSLRSE